MSTNWRNAVEDNKVFKFIVNLLFYGSMVAAVVLLFTSLKIYSLYIVCFWLGFILCIYWPLFLKSSPLSAFRDFSNIIDDPIDDLKHKIHGMTIFGHTIYLPKWLMRGKEEENQ